MRFNNRSRGLLLVKVPIGKRQIAWAGSFLPWNRRKRHVAEMQTGFFTVEVRHNFRRKMNENLFRSTIPIAAAGSSHTGRFSI
jgi:hypothetical protein